MFKSNRCCRGQSRMMETDIPVTVAMLAIHLVTSMTASEDHGLVKVVIQLPLMDTHIQVTVVAMAYMVVIQATVMAMVAMDNVVTASSQENSEITILLLLDMVPHRECPCQVKLRPMPRNGKDEIGKPSEINQAFI